MSRKSLSFVGSEPYGHGQRLDITRGWNDELARELVGVSTQPHIRATTPRDAAERFLDEISANEWYDNPRKQPTVYTMRLGELGHALSGFIWFSRQTHSDAPTFSYTSGFRLYEGAVGRGLARPFAEIAHEDFSRLHPGDGVWLETDVDNIPAVKLYQRIGYRAVATNGNRLVMTWQPNE